MTPHPARFSFASTLLAIAALLALTPRAVRGEIEFVGILVTPQKTLLALTDTATSRTDWVAVGGTFAGHAVSDFRPKDDTVALTKAGQTFRVRLKDDAKVKAARVELAGTISLGASDNMEVTRATLQFDQENVFPLKDGMIFRLTPTRLEDGNIEFLATFDRVLAENTRERISMPRVRARPGQPFKFQVGELGFSFTPLGP